MVFFKRVMFPLFYILFFSCTSGYSQITNATLQVIITDAGTGNNTPARVRLTNAKGHATIPPEEVIAVMYGRDDAPERYKYQPDSSWYIDGRFNLELAPGAYQMEVSKGLEYVDQKIAIQLDPAEKKEITLSLERWIHPADSGWYSADDHIHIRRSPRENPLILKWVEAEGLNVGILLQMGDFWTTYFGQYGFGEAGVYQPKLNMLTSGQEEPRTHEVGHTIALVADDFVRFRNDYYYYDKVFDQVHALDGIMGYAHQGMSFNGSRGMTLDVLDGKVDFLELLQFCVEGGPLLTQNYYRFLDLGFKLTATAGSDFPWCGIGPLFGEEGAPSWNARIGNVRFYTHIEGEFGYDCWKENLKNGHTFVSSGPILAFEVNNQIPGSSINLNQPGTVLIRAKAYGHADQVPLSKLEIIAHGKVIKEISPTHPGQNFENLTLDFDFKVNTGMWIAARCYAGPNQVAHTTPVYLTIGNQGFHNPETLLHYLSESEKYLLELEEALKEPHEHVNQRAWWYKKGLKQRIEQTRKIIDTLKNKF
jgi:hypothetical protein